MLEAGDDLSRMLEGVDAARSEKERMKDAFHELLGEMPAFQAFLSGTGAKEARGRRSEGESQAPWALGAPERQATELQSKVSGVTRSSRARLVLKGGGGGGGAEAKGNKSRGMP